MRKGICIFLAVMLTAFCFACSTGKIDIAAQPAEKPASEGVHRVVYGETASEPVAIHTDLQFAFLQQPYRSVFKSTSGQEEMSRPEPLILDWSDWAKTHGAESYIVTLSSLDGIDMRSYDTSGTTYAVFNLLLNSDYTWTVSANQTAGETCSFRTADTIIRNLYIDGVANAREIPCRFWLSAERRSQRQEFRNSSFPYESQELRFVHGPQG